MDAVLRAATSIVNSGKLKKLFKVHTVILLCKRPVLAQCFCCKIIQMVLTGSTLHACKSCIIPFLGGSVSNTAL